MTIAVNTRINKETQPECYEEFLFEMLKHLIKRFPQHQFIYIFDAPYKNIAFPKNVTSIVTGPKASSSIRLQYWFNYRIPVILRKHKADVFVSLEGICSLRTKVPQCLMLSDLAFLNHPQLLKKSLAGFYMKRTPAFVAKAKSIATVSLFAKLLIANRYKINPENIAVVHPCLNDIFKPVGLEEQEIIKEKYTQGKAYFLFSGNINQRSNIINLLKAFTFFKKRLKSNMMLLIAGNADDAFKKELKTYKLRNEVTLLENLDKVELAKITASAYAMVYPVLHDDIALPALQALQCDVPVILSDAGALPSVFGDAVLYVNPENYEDIAQKMMLVYKDEDKTNELVKSGKELLQQYQSGKTADLLMQGILKAFNS